MKNHGYTVWYSPVSKQDLKSIYAYIAYELRAKHNARGQTDRIRKSIRALSDLPERYTLVDWEPWHGMGMRKMPVDHYLVYYLVHHEAREVEIVRIFYGGRDIAGIIQSENL